MAINDKLRSVFTICLLAFLVLQLKHIFNKTERTNNKNLEEPLHFNGNPANTSWLAAESGYLSAILRKLSIRTDPPSENSSSRVARGAPNYDPAIFDIPASDDAWNTLVGKGCKLLALIGMNVEDADRALQDQSQDKQIRSQSQFTDYTDLTENGWKRTNCNNRKPFQILIDIPDALDDLDLSQNTILDGGLNDAIQWNQDQGGTYKGTDFDETGGRYYNVYNPSEGAIIALANYNPKTPEEAPEVKPRLPPLKQWSDVTFLEWESETTSDQIRGLRYIFRLNVENVQTRQAISRALYIHSHTPLPVGDEAPDLSYPPKWYPGSWPGVTFSTDTNEGQALLASPNAAGTAWLLIQHKAQFLGRSISKIQIFEDGDHLPGEAGSICMLLHIVDS